MYLYSYVHSYALCHMPYALCHMPYAFEVKYDKYYPLHIIASYQYEIHGHKINALITL